MFIRNLDLDLKIIESNLTIIFAPLGFCLRELLEISGWNWVLSHCEVRE